MDAYVDPPPPSLPKEDAAADALAVPSPDKAGERLCRSFIAIFAGGGRSRQCFRGAVARQFGHSAPAAAGAADCGGSARCPRSANGAAADTVQSRLSEAAQTLPSHCQRLQRERKRLKGV